MGSVDSTTVGRDGSVGLRAGIPPRSRMTSSGTEVGSADRERSRSAIAATTSAACRSLRASPIVSACLAVESTSRRRLTSHQIRVGAVRSAGWRSACDASHQMAISRQAVFPRPVGIPTSCGHSSVLATCLASRDCHGNGSRPLIAR